MSLSDEWCEWHLTPSGWEKGTLKLDHTPSPNPIPRPASAVATWRYEEHQSSSFSQMTRETWKIWHNGNAVQIGQLMKQWGDCPESL